MRHNVTLTDEQIEFLIRTCFCNYALEEKDINSTQGLASNTIAAEVVYVLLDHHKDFRNILNETRTLSIIKGPINKKLFMGNGNHSIIALNKLHKRLQFAAHQLGALEQNGGMGTEFDEKLDKDCTSDIVSVIKDIMYAFDVSKEDL